MCCDHFHILSIGWKQCAPACTVFGNRSFGEVGEPTRLGIVRNLAVPRIIETLLHPLAQEEKLVMRQIRDGCFNFFKRTHGEP